MTGHLLCRNIQSTYTLCTINHIFGTCVEQIVTLQSYEWGIIMFYACCFRSPKRCVMFHVDETSVHNCRKFNCENELYWNYKVLLPTTKQNEYTTFVETDMFSILREISDFWVAWTRDLFYRQMCVYERNLNLQEGINNCWRIIFLLCWDNVVLLYLYQTA